METASAFNEVRTILHELIKIVIEDSKCNTSDAIFQMRKINSTINELKKNNIPVPDELVKLKLTLSSTIDKVKDADKIKKELIHFLDMCILKLRESDSEKPAKKEKSKAAKTLERVNVIDMISASIILVNIEFYAYYKSRRVSATLLPNGSLEMTEKKKKKIYESPRAAAIAITGYQIDSWKFWKLDFEGKPLTLDDYRKKFLKERQKKQNATYLEKTETLTET